MLSQIYLNSFIYCFFYNDIWLGYRNRMQIKSPLAIFYLAFEALLLVYDRKGFVCSVFFCAVCREQHCWLLLTSYQSLFMRTHCCRFLYRREALWQESEIGKESPSDLIAGWLEKTSYLTDSGSIPNQRGLWKARLHKDAFFMAFSIQPTVISLVSASCSYQQWYVESQLISDTAGHRCR